jgi:radical SAM superfamily enzyme YgiQ (UPF0313 family)
VKWSRIEAAQRVLSREQGAVRKDWGGKLPIALIYPNTYYVGMSSLALQTLYRCLNAEPDIVCERVFCGFRGIEQEAMPLSLETQRPLSEFALLATSFSFELDYLNFAHMLRLARIPLLSAERDIDDPFLLAGGPAVSANPEPLADLCDAFVIGEVEEILPRILDTVRQGIGHRQALLSALASIPGVYVPELRGNDASFVARRQWVRDLDKYPTHTAIFARDTEFGDLHLMEIARGCGHRCRFCLAGCLYHPRREHGIESLMEQARFGKHFRQKAGLVSAAVSDYSQIGDLVAGLQDMGIGIAVSSLRLDPLPEVLLKALAASGTRTLTIAPEAGSERMRQAVRKGITRQEILEAAEMASEYFPELKLYFMIGLPDEEDPDIEAIVELTQAIGRSFRGRVAASVAPFVPKAHTAFERTAMAPQPVLKRRLRSLRTGLRRLGVRTSTESLAWSEVQATLSRGDRRLGRALNSLQGSSLASWHQAMASQELAAEEFTRARTAEEELPWAFVAM